MISMQAISDWIRREVEESGANGAVFGLSGGLDSSVVGVLCKKALGERCLGVIMPCHSAKSDIEDAKEVARLFEIQTKIIDLSSIFDSFVDLLQDISKIARANIKPRLRMITLYAFANDMGYIVVGTGNKSELSVGYFTKYGDGGVDILPLAGIYKTDLPPLARELGIPERIIGKPPSAGLWDGQTDEGEMGISYEELDAVLKSLESGTCDTGDEKVQKVRSMVERSTHKRTQPKSFSFG